MKTFAIIAIAGVIATAFFAFNSAPSSAVEEEFRSFLETYRNGYGTTEEYSYRLGVFADNLDRIAELNAQNPEATFAVNQFADRTPEEMTKMMGYNGNRNVVGTHVPPTTASDQDWTNMWSSIKNQGQCGSCWAFSATGSMESFALFKGQSVSLSEQQLVDCSKAQGNHGCNGGWPSSALKYAIANGMASSSEYPYVARDQTCKKNGGSFKIAGQSSYSGCSGLSNGVQSHPISVAVDANKWSSYKSGVFSSCGTSIDHAVLLVGIVGGNWKIKNSWGTGWGENGYIRLAGTSNTCGVCANAGVYPK